MSRPVLLSHIGTRFQIAIPTGWFTTISTVSRKIYNHLVTVDYEESGHRETASIADRYNVSNELMRDMTTREIALSITSQDGPQTIAINTYYSTDSTLAGDLLQDDLYRSTRANVITACHLYSA
ncbi:hypothetical protein H0H81_011864 [Sphagnurus paluster]|uniref:Uncharacterized protein n=1 Tax=Sphagnurus paluster TaxID=117069 RepID=A0A9P7KI64_9AGAR|nr:hypothetical protein H0H81_011864 [Sphagnurus paluster]